MANSRIDRMISELKLYTPPNGWAGELFLLPEDYMRCIYDLIVRYGLTSCLELGTGFGTTSCIITSALEQLGKGRLTTVDRCLHHPVNANVLLEHLNIDRRYVNVVVDELGYNWYLAELLSKHTSSHSSIELFDFCFLDGSHEWEPDALAFLLASKLLKPGGWMVLDDLDFRLRMVDQRPEYHNRSTRELDAYQVRMIFDLLMIDHPDFGYIRIFPGQRMVWARKLRPIWHPLGLVDRARRIVQVRNRMRHVLGVDQ